MLQKLCTLFRLVHTLLCFQTSGVLIEWGIEELDSNIDELGERRVNIIKTPMVLYFGHVHVFLFGLRGSVLNMFT